MGLFGGGQNRRVIVALAVGVLLGGALTSAVFLAARTRESADRNTFDAASALYGPPVATILADDGVHRLWIDAVLREGDDEQEYVQVHARLNPWSEHLILDEVLVDGLAEGEPSTASSSNKRLHVWPNSDGQFVVGGIAISQGAAQLGRLVLEVRLGTVGRWRTERLELRGADATATRRCGPFILDANVKDGRLHVTAGAWGEDGAQDWREWRAASPLKRLGHSWITQGGLEVRNAHGTELFMESAVGEGGFTSASYSSQPFGAVPAPGTSNTGFAYPLSLAVRLPEQVRMTAIRFDLQGVDIPSLRSP